MTLIETVAADRLRLHLVHDDGPVRLLLRPAVEVGTTVVPAQPLVEALAVGHGRNWAGRRLVGTQIGERLRYRSHRLERDGAWQTLWLTQVDPVTRLEFTSQLAVHDSASGLRSVTHVRNTGDEPVTLQAVSSLVFADFDVRGPDDLAGMTLLRGQGDWLAEGRWQEEGLRAAGLPLLHHRDGRRFRTRGCVEASSTSTWSTAYEQPTFCLGGADRRWSAQIEHNGAWVWQVGENADGVYAALYGPTDELHQWRHDLEPGTTFSSVPVALTVECAAETAGLAALTTFRRVSLPSAPRGSGLVVFNDYMNTVNGNPSAEVLHPLVDAAAAAGADVFVVDAGWYADDGDWWDTVGEWQPSVRRFPDGLGAVLAHVRERGMRAGLWVEPEVVGVQSPMADKLPDDAFLRLDGQRLVEHGRYHLDFTSPAAIAFVDEVIDRLVGELGVGYFKFDYNIRAGAGADGADVHAGHGLLLHTRAYLDWVAAVRRRYPDLILENCASGGMRADFATVSRFDMQSTSDQEDFLAYPPIAASAPMTVLPEQAGNWAYPQPGMSDAGVVFCLCTGVLGRLYLSGWLTRLPQAQRALVAQAVAAHRELLPLVGCSTPVWPLGLPGWEDDWIALALVSGVPTPELLVAVWYRGDARGEVDLRLPDAPAAHRWSSPRSVFPDTSDLVLDLTASGRALRVRASIGRPAARVVRLTAGRD